MLLKIFAVMNSARARLAAEDVGCDFRKKMAVVCRMAQNKGERREQPGTIKLVITYYVITYHG